MVLGLSSFFFFSFFSIQNLFHNNAGSGVSFCSHGWPVGLWALGAYVAMWGSWGLAEMPGHLSALSRTGEEDRATALGRGASRASWSKGRILPLALGMWLWCGCLPSVSWPGRFIFRIIRESDRGGRWVRLTNSLFRPTWLKVESVCPEACADWPTALRRCPGSWACQRK